MQTEEIDLEAEYGIKDKKKKKKKRKRSLLARIISLVLVLLIAFLGFEVWYWFDCQKPVSSSSEVVTFQVEDGETFRTVTTKLAEEGLIKNANIAYYYAKLNGYSNVYAGKFSLDKNMSLETILQTLGNQSSIVTDDVSVTLIEGDWAKHIAEKIASVSNVSYDDLIALWSNADWIRSQMADYPFLTEEMFQDGVRIYLEGYLAPNTYTINPEWGPEEITRKILDQTLVLYQQYQDQFTSSSLSVHQIFTMASIVQYEGSTNLDVLKNISSVFYNRLNVGMALQSSVTVCYAIDYDHQTDNWQSCEINTDFDSPYNTYQNAGLPPGAIENAGAEALEAVLNPYDTNYYYFMADVYGDGTVYFSETLEEHTALVNKYLYGQ